jgi:uncharacterized membrane protein SpoIIM required for sporulation
MNNIITFIILIFVAFVFYKFLFTEISIDDKTIIQEMDEQESVAEQEHELKSINYKKLYKDNMFSHISKVNVNRRIYRPYVY